MEEKDSGIIVHICDGDRKEGIKKENYKKNCWDSYILIIVPEIQKKNLIYFELKFTLLARIVYVLATTLLWDMNHVGHGTINNKKALLF